MNKKNILFSKKVRTKNKGFLSFINPFYFYYEDESLSLKEKLYTLWYNMEVIGATTNGEMAFFERIVNKTPSEVLQFDEEFKTDYKEYILSK